MTGSPAAPETRIIDSVPCPVCGCVCDDLQLEVSGTELRTVHKACRLADPWFQAQAAARPPAVEIEGQAGDFESGLDRAAELLQKAHAPLVYGLSRSSTPGQRAALHLADHLGAIVDTTASVCHGPSIMAVQQVGESTCTLGEVRNRAELVIFWGCDPSATHPRHAERYSVFATGRWMPHGRQDRTVIMIGDERSIQDWRLDSNDARPDLIIPLRPRRDFEVISVLRALVNGQSLTTDQVREEELGVSLATLQALADRLRSARCGIVFFGLGLTETAINAGTEPTGLGHLNVENLLQLVSELNSGETRFYARRMRIQGDVTGADAVMCWQTGYPFSVSLARGYPRYNPGEFSAAEVLQRREVDACLIVGSETVRYFPDAARDYLQQIPTIVLDYPATQCPVPATVRFTTAVYGLHAPGTIYRMDEVPLELKAALPAPYATDEAVLTALTRRLFPESLSNRRPDRQA